jgi:O-succinylbenzoic acid--CoA ligase
VSSASASLHPVAGPPAEVDALVRSWLVHDGDPLVVRTSGTTGAPKDVLLSARALRASAEATLRRLGGPGRWLLALPVQYVAGLQVVVRSAVAGVASPVLLDEHPDLLTATQALASDRTYTSIVPTQLHRWLADDDSAAALASFDAVLLGGGPAPVALLERARDSGVAVVTTYGMSETSGGCVYDGYPLDGVAVALAADGRIRISGPVLFDGYAGDPASTAAVLRDGWLETPDLGEVDADGYLRVIGRADDVVVSGGVNVSLSAVERRLATMPGVDACAVIALPDPEWGSRVVAVVEIAVPDARLDVTEVRDYVSAEHPRTWAPRDVMVVRSLPMLASGKVDRQELLTWWADE